MRNCQLNLKGALQKRAPRYLVKPRLIKIALSTRDIVVSFSSPILSFSLRLSSVRICSRRITESFCRPYAFDGSSMCVGNFALLILLVDVVLDDQYRSDSSLFAAHDGRQIGIIQFSSLNVHINLLSAVCIFYNMYHRTFIVD